MILVTGACGFIGRNLVRALTKHFPERQIHALDRVEPELGSLTDRVKYFHGLLNDPVLLSGAMRNVEVVVHLAAKVEPHSQNSQEMWEVNVVGATKAYSAAIASGCRLFIHVSSAGIYGNPREARPFREDDVAQPVTPYQLTKWEAEISLRRLAGHNTALNILRPAGLYGPGSLLEIPAYKKVLATRWSLEPRGGVVVHPTHVQDIVESIIALIDRPAAHHATFNIGGERMILTQELFALQAETLKVRRRRIVLPKWIGSPMAGSARLIFSIMNRPVPLIAEMLNGSLFYAAVDDRRFRHSYSTVPIVKLTDGLREHFDWARKRQLI